ncbi:hypothetical protein RFI_09874 [Reticulomyxa filosa]|uniref:PH domain-containing protein n=1 Tax=Reticulomyxa filosa TaxID=46433 RepID=X6NNG6_RETFI|nr:hypothetical protein RFI_09874 [Reticulomyxa filosa]|eukprot:ETO27259.1 hypothetical protein RFI_09874 [Reticulomyxa filosa]
MGLELEIPFKKDVASVDSTLSRETLTQYRHDLLICLLEWVARKKTLAIVIDEIQFLDTRDWQMTRRLALVIQKKMIKNVILLLGGMPMDNRRYVPHFTPPKRILEYIDVRNSAHIHISPHLWTWHQTKEWIITELEVRDCSKFLVDTIHFECGGRPGFCAEFLSTLTDTKEPWIQILVNKNDKSDRIATFNEVIEEKLKVGIDVRFPIPSYIQSMTAAQLDCVSTELLMCMKTAAVICKAKGNRSRQFEEEMLRGTHPVEKMAEKRQLRKTLVELKNMGFIVFVDSTDLGLAHATTIRAPDSTAHEEELVDKLLDSENETEIEKESGSANASININININIITNGSGNGNESEKLPITKSLPNLSIKENHNPHDTSLSWSLSSSSFALTKMSHPDATDSGTNSPVHKNSAADELNVKDESAILTPASTLSKRPTSRHNSNTLANAASTSATDVDDSKNNKKTFKSHHRRDSSTEVDDYNNDPMPSIISLLQDPSADIPYKKGRMYKRGVTAFNFTEKERFFVFKHHTLYWFKETDKEQYPVNRIKFVPGIDIQLKREDEFHLKIQTSRKFYVLRTEKKKDMNEWHDLFKKALKEDKDGHESANGGSPTKNKMQNSCLKPDENIDPAEEYYSKCHIYEFSYGFLRDVIYEQTLHAQRQQLHTQANKYIEQLLSKSYDHNLALLQERHQELGSDKDIRKKDELSSYTKLRRRRHSKHVANMYVQDTAPKQTKNSLRE